MTEPNQLSSNRKPDGQRPRIYNSTTGQFQEISRDFEAFIIATPIGFRARVGQYLAALGAASYGPGSMDELRTEWLNERYNDLDSSINAYGTIVTSYDEIRKGLVEAAVGFDSVAEYQQLMTDLNKVVGKYIDEVDSLKFDKSVANVLRQRSTSTSTSSPIQAELDSFIQAFLTYP